MVIHVFYPNIKAWFNMAEIELAALSKIKFIYTATQYTASVPHCFCSPHGL